MGEANGISTPLPGGCKLSKFGSVPLDNPALYRSIVGALLMGLPLLGVSCPLNCFWVGHAWSLFFPCGSYLISSCVKSGDRRSISISTVGKAILLSGCLNN